MRDVGPGAPRKTCFAPFGAASCDQGPVPDRLVPGGVHCLAYRDPHPPGGDDAPATGAGERFGLRGNQRAIVDVPRRRRDEELHVFRDGSALAPVPAR